MNLDIYFCLLVGDYVCETCNVWKYYLAIVERFSWFYFDENFFNKTNSSVREHYSGNNSLYMTTFKTNMKPKHHFLIHYPSCILKTGPISLNWSMRSFESKHCLLKLISNVTKSRINLSKTIMTRYSYIFAHDLYSCVVFSRRLISDIGPQQGIEGCYRWVVWQGVTFNWEILPALDVLRKQCQNLLT